MLQLKSHKGAVKVSAGAYNLICAADRPYIYLTDPKGRRLADLFVLSSVHTTRGQDDTVKIGAWRVEPGSDVITLSITAESSIWSRKTYRFMCEDTRFTYDIEVENDSGNPLYMTDALYFGGYYSGQVRWGSGFFASGQTFRRVFNPEPTTAETYHLPPSSGTAIDLTGVPLPGKGSWFFTPPPFCFAAQVGRRWIGMGVEAAPGENRFTQFSYHGQHEAFHLSLAYEGHSAVGNVYRLPAIGFDFAGSEYEAIESHAASLRRRQFASDLHTEKAAWWYEPIFCGWGTQCYAASRDGGRAPDYARQSLYEENLAVLAEQGLAPGIVVLDDKWQATYGENAVDEAKWPDLRGFINRQHAAGRKVLLWLKAWDPEGVPAGECVTNAAGLSLTVDPTNPAFEQRFRAAIRRMLSPEGYDADGFKIDFTARIPVGPGAQRRGEAWGLELMKQYLGIIYDEAKQAKPDALVMSHTPHPYLADVLDMIRLNDVNTRKDVNRQMTHRQKIAAIACPDAIIDTDNWPMPNRSAWRAYVSHQLTLGVPSLYFATHIDATGEPLEADDYALVRDVWGRHRARHEHN